LSGFFFGGVTRRKSGSGHPLYLFEPSPKKRVPKKDAAPTPYAIDLLRENFATTNNMQTMLPHSPGRSGILFLFSLKRKRYNVSRDDASKKAKCCCYFIKKPLLFKYKFREAVNK
jgi:hypothetical protein